MRRSYTFTNIDHSTWAGYFSHFLSFTTMELFLIATLTLKLKWNLKYYFDEDWDNSSWYSPSSNKPLGEITLLTSPNSAWHKVLSLQIGKYNLISKHNKIDHHNLTNTTWYSIISIWSLHQIIFRIYLDEHILVFKNHHMVIISSIITWSTHQPLSLDQRVKKHHLINTSSTISWSSH